MASNNTEEQFLSEESDDEYTQTEYDIQSHPADYTLEVIHNKWLNGDIEIPKL